MRVRIPPCPPDPRKHADADASACFPESSLLSEVLRAHSIMSAKNRFMSAMSITPS
jgi:hypothetical protein